MFILHIDSVDFNVDKIVEDIEGGIDAGMEVLAEEIEWQWRKKAAETLEATRDEYLSSLSVDRYGNEIQVQLNGEMATAVETGSEPFDLKPGFLGGALYRIIPIAPGYPRHNPRSNEARRFRTVSRNSPPDSWWHPGIQARNIGQQVQDELKEGKLEQIFQEAFASRTTV